MSKASSSLWTRYWANVVNGPNGCWLWVGATSRGYGHIRYDGRQYLVHRLSYRWFVGPIPSWLQIDHRCRNRACVNPTHLEAVTGQVNILRGETGHYYQQGQPCCPNGHEYTPENTFITKRPNRTSRGCRICKQANNARYTQNNGPRIRQRDRERNRLRRQSARA